MKPFSTVAIAMFALTGVSFAQVPAKAPAPAPPQPKPDVKVDAKLKVDPKPAAPETKIPQELTDMGKLLTGTWRCKGEYSGLDGTKKAMTATTKNKVDLDKWWIVSNFESKAGAGPTAMNFKFVSYTTFDAASKKWRRVMVDNWGGHMVGTSDGMKDSKSTFNMDAWGPAGPAMLRDYTDMTDAKAGARLWGEMSMDKGKTWNKVYEMVCKK